MIRAFADHAGGYPWQWLPQMVDEWSMDLRSVRGLRRSTLRGYQEAVRLFCDYLTDPTYDWAAECQQRFGSHPVQVCHEWNTAVHVQEGEADPAKRAVTVVELQALFDYADEQVTRIRGVGRKGWLPAFRNATLLKVAYGYGLRRLGQLLQQPVRTRQRQALLLRRPNQLGGSLRLRRRFGPLLASGLVVQCRGHHGTLLTRHNARQVRPETPLDPQTRGAFGLTFRVRRGRCPFAAELAKWPH